MPIETELWRARIGTFQGSSMSRKEYLKASIIAGCLMLAIIIFCLYSMKFKLSQCGDVEVNPGPTLDDKLTLADLHQVHTLLYEARTTWFNMGLALCVNNETLRSFRRQYTDDGDCLRETLAVRLSSAAQLSFAMICAVLREPSIGRTDVAQMIEENTTLTESTKKVGNGTATCHTGTTASSSAVSQSDVQGRKNVPAAQQVKLFEERFYDLRIAAQKDLKKRVTVEDLRLTVTTLPAEITHEHDKFLKSKFRFFEKAKSVDGIFLQFNTYLSFLDFSLLEHIIKHLCSAELKQQMEQYSEDMRSFRKVAMISDVIPFLPRPSKKIPNDYSELDIEVDIKTLRTLEDLDQYRRLCLGEFLLSRLAIHVHLKSIKEGSLCLSWLIPSDIIPALKSHLLKQNILSFQELNILKLFLDKECLYPLPDKKRTSQEMAQELFQASEEGDLQKVTDLVSRGVDIDSRDEDEMLEDAIRHRVDELVQHIHPYKQGGVASPSPTLLASLPLLPVQREASPASASQTEPSGNGSSFKIRFSEQPARSPPPSANEGETTLLGHPLNAFGNQGGTGYVPLPSKPLNQFADSDDKEDTQPSLGGGSTSELAATAMSKMDFGKPLNEFNEPSPTEHDPANVVGPRSNALMHDHSDEDIPGGQTEPPNQTLFGQPLTVPPHSTHQADTGGQSTACQPEQPTSQALFLDDDVVVYGHNRSSQSSHTFGQELDLQPNAYVPSPVSPSSEAVLATTSAKPFGQLLADKDHGGEVHSSYRATMERLPPETQTLPNPSSHSEHAQFSTQTSVSMTMPAVSQVTHMVANDFNIATNVPSTQSTHYTNNLRAYSEKETLHEQGVGNNKTPYREDVSSNLPSDNYSDDEPPLRARLDPNEEQLFLAQEDDGDWQLFAPRLKTPPPEWPPSPTTSGRPFHSLQAPELLQGTQASMEVLHEFAQICISAASKTRGQEKLMEMASSSGYDHLASFFIGYFFNAAEFSRGGKLVTEFIGGAPSPLNFLISNSLATKASFEAVLFEMGKQDFPDQLLLALHQFPGSDHFPSSGQAMVNALFNHTFVIGSIETSNSQQDPNGRLQELSRNLNDRYPTPPPPKSYSGPPQETKYEFPAQGGHHLGTRGDDTQELSRNLNDRSPTPPTPKPYSGPPQETKYEFPAQGGHRPGTRGDDTQKDGTVSTKASKSPQSMPRGRRSPVKPRDSNTEEALKRTPMPSSPSVLQSNSGTALAGSISDAESTSNSFSQRFISPTPSRTSQLELQKQLEHVTSFTAEPPNFDARLSIPSPIKVPCTDGMYHPNSSQTERKNKDTDLQNDWTSTGLSALSSTGSQENDRLKSSPPLLPCSELTIEYYNEPEDDHKADHMTALMAKMSLEQTFHELKRSLRGIWKVASLPVGKTIVPSLHTGYKTTLYKHSLLEVDSVYNEFDKDLPKHDSETCKRYSLRVKQENRSLSVYNEFDKELPKYDSETRVSKETQVEDTTETSPTTNEDWNDLGAADDLETSTLTSTVTQPPPPKALLSSHDQIHASHRQESAYSSCGISHEEGEDEKVTTKPRNSQMCESKTLSLSVQQPLTVFNPLQLSFPNFQIRDKDREKLFHTLAPKIRQWTFLGRSLNIDDETLEEIASSYHFDVERCYQMLCRWRIEATYHRLAQGLKDIMREDLYPDLISQIPSVRELSVDQERASHALQEREHIDMSEDEEGFVVDLPPTDEGLKV